MSYYISHEDDAKQETIKCYIWAVVITLGMFAVLVYGFAWLESTEKMNAKFYGAKYLEERIEVLESVFLEHTHIYNGKVRLIPIPTPRMKPRL